MKSKDVGIVMLGGDNRPLQVDEKGRIIVKLCNCDSCQHFVNIKILLEWVKSKDLKIVIEN